VADSGAISWITPVESRVSGGLIFADMNGDGADEVGGGFSDGSVRFFNPEDGSHSIFVDLTGGDAIRAVHADNLRGEATPELFLASSGRLRCIEDGRTVAWEYELSGVQSVVTAQLNDGARVLATTERGALVCLTAQGLPEWTDTRATAGIAGAPIVADFNQDDRKEAVTASRDHHLRVIDLCDPSPLEKPKVIRKPMTGTQ
jgi:outer membrane protein assembly factor BamB